jgi:hypothetical protein
MKETRWVKCPRDGYTWETTGQLALIPCPSCGYKFKIEDNLVQPPMVQFNAGEKGVKIQDPSLATKYSPHGFIVDVYFKDGKAFCDYCQSSECKHVEYALSLPLVQKIFKKKGWKNA